MKGDTAMQEVICAVINPATGTSLPIPLFIISGVVLVGCVVFAIVSKNMKNKKNKNGKPRKR